MAANTFILRVWYPAFSREPAVGRVVRTAAGRQRNLMMRHIARTVRQATPRRTGRLRRGIRYRSIQNRNGLAISRLSTRRFYSSFVDEGKGRGGGFKSGQGWFTDATDEPDIMALVEPLLGQWEANLRFAIERAAARILKRAESDAIKVRISR